VQRNPSHGHSPGPVCRIVAGGAAVVLLVAAGCGRKPEAASRADGGGASGAPAGPVELIYFCGAGIRPAAERLIAAFEDKTGHMVRIRATYAGSGRLLGQISATRRGDLFMPGAELYVDLAVKKSLAIPETRRVVAWFVPVIFVKKGNPLGIHSLDDLLRPGVRLGLGDERSCAIGRRTLKILKKNGIDPERIERNVAFRSATVNELAVAVQMGSIDAAILWDANARQFAENGDMVPIPLEKNVVSAIPIVVLSCSSHRKEAEAFVEFVASEAGRRIFRESGYTTALPGKAPSDAPSPAGEKRP